MQVIPAADLRRLLDSKVKDNFHASIGEQLLEATLKGKCELSIEAPNVHFGISLEVVLKQFGYHVTRTVNTLIIRW